MALVGEVTFETKDNRVGMGIGGRDYHVVAKHVPSGVVMTFPSLQFSHRHRNAILEAFEYMFHEMREWEYLE